MWPRGSGTGGGLLPGCGSEWAGAEHWGRAVWRAQDGAQGSRPCGGRRGRRARAGRAAVGVRGEGAGGGQRAGSRRGGSGYRGPALPPAARARRPGRLGPSPAVCISLAGGGARVERNRLHLERCLFFLTSPRRQTTLERGGRTRRALAGKGSGLGSARREGMRPGSPAAGLGEGSRWGRERLSSSQESTLSPGAVTLALTVRAAGRRNG